MLAVLINGVAPDDRDRALSASDRGFHYGDGLFETIRLSAGRIRFLDDHLQRLWTGCERLAIAPPARTQLLEEIERVVASHRDGVLKIVISRGTGGRGYRTVGEMQCTRMVALYPAPADTAPTLTVQWCDTRMGRNARLAGLKHLNRLEQVLAQNEWRDPAIGEGLMLDTEGELVSATAGNIFLVRDGVLATTDLRFCGVRGVMRAQALRAAAALGVPTSEEPLWPTDLDAATEVFITNAVRGIRSVIALGNLRWQPGPIAQRLSQALTA
jgi:4-amino-4-deoxychorismate lyase